MPKEKFPVTVLQVDTGEMYEWAKWSEGRGFICEKLGVMELERAPVDIYGWAHYPGGWRMSHSENQHNPSDWENRPHFKTGV